MLTGASLNIDMVESEEQRIQEREKAVLEHEEQERKGHKLRGKRDRPNLNNSREVPKDQEKKKSKGEEGDEDEESHEGGKPNLSSEGTAPKKK